MDHMGANEEDNVCFDETEYQINGELVPRSVSQMKQGIRRIECLNTNLFGDKVFLLQEFPEQKHDADSLKKEIINLVEHHKIHHLLPHYRVMTSKFNVIQSNSVDICYKIEFLPNTKMDHLADGTIVNDLCFRETDYIIDGVSVPHTISAPSIKGSIHRIQCRNTKLFGDRDVWTQDFEGPFNSKRYDSMEEEIIDLVEHHQAYQLLPHYRVLTSKFQVIHSLNLCTLQLIPNTKMNHIAKEGVVNDLCFEETEYIADGVTVPFTASTINGNVHCIQCRNPKLFGDRQVWSQLIDDPHEALKEGKLGLTVFEERGHHAEDHAKYLLDQNRYSCYSSKHGSSGSDWIVFELEQLMNFYPTKLMIRNSAFNSAIKSMIISWSINGEEYHEGTRIDNI